ncbi:MAG: hypothetical protein IJ400_01015 [Clostridia bacterium]|nr:hypothetical protein [Clostridia bacterium]
MGFGLMFIGYFIAYLGTFISEISVFTYILGVGIIILSLRKLIFENKLFIVSSIVAILLEISSIAVAIMGFMGVSESHIAYLIFGQAYQWGTHLLNIMLMLAIFVIARDVDVLKIKVMSLISTSLIGICVGFLIAYLCINDQFTRERLMFVSMLLQVAFTVLGLITIFNCYMKICYEDDKNMEKETGNPVIDFLNRQLDNPFNRKNKPKGKK